MQARSGRAVSVSRHGATSLPPLTPLFLVATLPRHLRIHPEEAEKTTEPLHFTWKSQTYNARALAHNALVCLVRMNPFFDKHKFYKDISAQHAKLWQALNPQLVKKSLGRLHVEQLRWSQEHSWVNHEDQKMTGQVDRELSAVAPTLETVDDYSDKIAELVNGGNLMWGHASSPALAARKEQVIASLCQYEKDCKERTAQIIEEEARALKKKMKPDAVYPPSIVYPANLNGIKHIGTMLGLAEIFDSLEEDLAKDVCRYTASLYFLITGQKIWS
eukprot:Blabericola_migrator_1__837@NODE_1206_length_5110_cov_47_888757_g818_i0_p3_GENE_NODE_1206_length_5110_cov_47_888757_g818_i0NODE_1206_length_5110_cov_47_888757_g818_i0_p3_ORF_typecomplete_len274_score40_10DUF4456/PF14644_6/54DUF4456/PF14644_6/3_7_NODE_1206_length_5110_cov_47_888757_g818_i042505071